MANSSTEAGYTQDEPGATHSVRKLGSAQKTPQKSTVIGVLCQRDQEATERVPNAQCWKQFKQQIKILSSKKKKRIKIIELQYGYKIHSYESIPI